MALRIKSLLYDQGYTIPGARQLLKGELKQKSSQLPLASEADGRAEAIRAVRQQMQDLLDVLSRDGGTLPAIAMPARRQRSSHTPIRRTMDDLFNFPD
jgi:hypothetical protein